jgi:hypothetical protein
LIWETVGAAAEKSISPPPTTEEVVPEGPQQQTDAVEVQASVKE